MTVLCASLMIASCTGSFEEVNTDPDNPLAEDVPATNILAYCERYASDNLFDEWFDLNESCGFSGQIAKWMYPQEGFYNFRPTVNSSSWRVCDYVAVNLRNIIDNEGGNTNMWAAATIFQCQIWQIKTDRWGNIPYWTPNQVAGLNNEALSLSDGITKPVYDKQSLIYADMLKRLEQAVKVLESGASDDLGSGDVLLGGDTDLWAKYGNALRLRLAARIANIDPTTAKKVAQDVLEDGLYPEDNSDNVFFNWNAEYPEPWADYYNSRKNEYGVSELMVNTLQDYLSDPRLSVYCTPIRADGVSYIGYPVGMKTNAAVQNYSQIGNRFQNRSGMTGFSPWLRSCEVYFQLAYLDKKLDLDGVDADEAYKTGITLSMEENGIDAADIALYLESDKVKDATIDNIFLQWWISLYKNGQEAWSVYRMAPTDTYLFQNNKIAVDSYFPNHNCPPMCYGYPDTERNLNSANCSAESQAEVDYFWGKKMWWDTRTGLY